MLYRRIKIIQKIKRMVAEMKNYTDEYTHQDEKEEKAAEYVYAQALKRCPEHCIHCRYLSGECDLDIIIDHCNLSGGRPDENILFCPEQMKITRLIDLSPQEIKLFFNEMNRGIA